MEYEWEAKARRLLRHMDGDLGSFTVIGFAVLNWDNGEAALLRFDDLDGIDAADAWKDVSGDAIRIYNETVDGLHAKKSPPPDNSGAGQ